MADHRAAVEPAALTASAARRPRPAGVRRGNQRAPIQHRLKPDHQPPYRAADLSASAWPTPSCATGSGKPAIPGSPKNRSLLTVLRRPACRGMLRGLHRVRVPAPGGPPRRETSLWLNASAWPVSAELPRGLATRPRWHRDARLCSTGAVLGEPAPWCGGRARGVVPGRDEMTPIQLPARAGCGSPASTAGQRSSSASPHTPWLGRVWTANVRHSRRTWQPAQIAFVAAPGPVTCRRPIWGRTAQDQRTGGRRPAASPRRSAMGGSARRAPGCVDACAVMPDASS